MSPGHVVYLSLSDTEKRYMPDERKAYWPKTISDHLVKYYSYHRQILKVSWRDAKIYLWFVFTIYPCEEQILPASSSFHVNENINQIYMDNVHKVLQWTCPDWKRKHLLYYLTLQMSFRDSIWAPLNLRFWEPSCFCSFWLHFRR